MRAVGGAEYDRVAHAFGLSRSPGRFVVRKEIELPRPRDLEVTYTPEFTDIVHELRGHIGAIRQPVGQGGALPQ